MIADANRIATLTAEIDRHKRAMVAREATLASMTVEPHDCCPSCKHGAAYVEPARRQDRCGENLARLLRKRALPGDEDLARAIEVSA